MRQHRSARAAQKAYKYMFDLPIPQSRSLSFLQVFVYSVCNPACIARTSSTNWHGASRTSIMLFLHTMLFLFASVAVVHGLPLSEGPGKMADSPVSWMLIFKPSLYSATHPMQRNRTQWPCSTWAEWQRLVVCLLRIFRIFHNRQIYSFTVITLAALEQIRPPEMKTEGPTVNRGLPTASQDRLPLPAKRTTRITHLRIHPSIINGSLATVYRTCIII